MRFLLALLLPAFIATPAFAKSKAKKPGTQPAARAASKFSGDLLSYHQLMKLSKAKRMKYIKDTVELLATMESFNTRYSTAEIDRIRDMREKFAYLMQMMAFMPEAQADEYDDAVVDEDLSKIVPSLNGGQWTCGRKAVFDYSIRACVALNPGGTSAFTPSNVNDGGTNGVYCPAGTHEVPHYRPGMSACIPSANWALIPQARRDGIAKGGFLKPGYLREQSLEDQRQAVLGGKPDPDQADVPAPAPGTAGAPTAPGSVAGVPAAPGTAAPGGPAPGGPEPGTAAPGAVAPGSPAPGAAPGASPPAAPATCEPAVKTCKAMSEGDRQTAIQRFRSTAKYQGEDANVCIAGGFLSKYETAKKEPGTCKILRAIPLPNGRSTVLCASDEALCNPALFCLGGANPSAGNKFEPATFCVKTNQGGGKNNGITEACAAKYARILEKKEPMITCKVDPKLKGEARKKAQKDCAAKDKEYKKIEAKVCDPAYTPEGNFKKIWDDLIAQTKKLRDVWCGVSDFAALFCRECEIVNDRIYAMNKAATDSGCAEPAPAASPATGAPVTPAPPATGVREEPQENREDGR